MRRKRKTTKFRIINTLLMVSILAGIYFLAKNANYSIASPKTGTMEINENITDIDNEKILGLEEIENTNILWLVNADHPIPGNSQIQAISSYQRLALSSTDIAMQQDALASAEWMFTEGSDGQTDGYVITSGYRTDVRQQELYDEAEDKSYVQKPNCSEHQTGLAMDVSLTNGTSDFGTTAQGKWLTNNAYKFGFILRYPADKTDITGISFEPWHFRYVGIPHAAFITRKGLCFEEYIDWLKTHEGYNITVDKQNYYVYRTTSQDGTIKVPDQENYSVSDDNDGGYIITVNLN